MTQWMPLRSRLESLFSRSPFEDWMRAFADGRLPALLREKRFPHADIAETENEYLISIELPGTKEEEVEVRLIGDRLLVSGGRERETEREGKQFRRMECSHGAFRRSFELPASVRKDPESIHATLENGMLEIRVSKIEPDPVIRIPVKSSGESS